MKTVVTLAVFVVVVSALCTIRPDPAAAVNGTVTGAHSNMVPSDESSRSPGQVSVSQQSDVWLTGATPPPPFTWNYTTYMRSKWEDGSPPTWDFEALGDNRYIGPQDDHWWNSYGTSYNATNRLGHHKVYNKITNVTEGTTLDEDNNDYYVQE